MAGAPSARSRIRRVPARARYDRATVEAILDEALVSHLGLAQDGQPFVLPVLHARVGDTLYLHGSTASRVVRHFATGAPACLTATLVDGLVLARSAFHHSVNYRSVVVLGTPRLISTPDECHAALEALTERLVPGRWAEVRPPGRQELKATRLLAMTLDEASAKVREGPPLDDEDDYALDVWAGVIPLRTIAAAPEPDDRLAAGVEPSAAVTDWSRRRSAM